MQTIYQKMETTELDAAIEALKAEVAEVKAKGLALYTTATSTVPTTAALRAFPRHAS